MVTMGGMQARGESKASRLDLVSFITEISSISIVHDERRKKC